MSNFQRYAIYYLPDDPQLAAFGASWLGWDVETGCEVVQPPVDGIARITETPRKYGFHGTLKPPFRLAEDTDADSLAEDISALAARTAPVIVDALTCARIGRFLALTPRGNASALGDLAFACVSELDHHRRPASESELERRRAAGLTDLQEALLMKWGYPYVADEFRFHLTLSGKLDDATAAATEAALDGRLPTIPQPFEIKSISLVGEREDGRFSLIHRYALTG